MRSVVSVSLPENINCILNELAVENDRSKSYIIQRTIEYYASEQADLNIALFRLNDNNDKIVSLKDMRANLEL